MNEEEYRALNLWMTHMLGEQPLITVFCVNSTRYVKKKLGHDRNSTVVLETWQVWRWVGHWRLFLRNQHKPALVCVTSSVCLQTVALVFVCPFAILYRFCILWLIKCFYVLLGQRAVVPTTFMPESWTDSKPFNGISRFCGFWLVFSIVIEERFTRFIWSPELPVQQQGCVFLDYSGQDEYFIVLVRFYIWMTTHP